VSRGGVAGSIIAIAASLAACAPQGQAGVIGASNVPAGAAHPGAAGADGGSSGPPAANPIPSDFRASMTRVGGRFSSKGHAGGRWDALVYADAKGLAAMNDEHAPVAEGARLVEEHFERSDGGAGPIMMMEKKGAGFDATGGDWRYVAVGSRGEVVKDGVVESCSGCHGEAPGDHLFRVER
jgi:hypothetical protein